MGRSLALSVLLLGGGGTGLVVRPFISSGSQRCAGPVVACETEKQGNGFFAMLFGGERASRPAQAASPPPPPPQKSRYVPPEQWIDNKTDAALAWEVRQARIWSARLHALRARTPLMHHCFWPRTGPPADAPLCRFVCIRGEFSSKRNAAVMAPSRVRFSSGLLAWTDELGGRC
eukprot:scaffold24896_cov110-Isochrysis_galbana.AAC.2